jgi:hypothetical protein
MILTITQLTLILGFVFIAGGCFGVLMMCLVQINRED